MVINYSLVDKTSFLSIKQTIFIKVAPDSQAGIFWYIKVIHIFWIYQLFSIDEELTEEGWRKQLLALTGGETVFLFFKFILTTKVPL